MSPDEWDIEQAGGSDGVRVAAPHLCGGPTCYFCEWSNPTLDIPVQDT